jgi:hypothetical protein
MTVFKKFMVWIGLADEEQVHYFRLEMRKAGQMR